jgi:hypothetical protein
MKGFLFFFLAVAFFVVESEGQSGDINPCGTVGGRSAWLKKYQIQPEAYPKMNDTILYVPLTIHQVGADNGGGYFSTPRLLQALCTLNEDFAQANIQFYIEGGFSYLANSAYNNHETVVDGAFMMFDNNVPNTLNCYIVSNPAGNCGYNLPYAGIALNKSCIGPNDHTWAHEVGHAFSLPHPFLGWEGGVSHDGSVPHNFNNPAPTEVYYDYTFFKDTLILDTLIIDTALVELVDGSNCHIAADGFCDTGPDYLSNRWQCSGAGQSLVTQRDPANVPFVSDGSLIMSYAFDNCSFRFTPEQIAAMRANLLDEKPNLLYNQTPGEQVTGAPSILISPLENQLVQFDEVYLEWEAVANATHYVIQVSRLPNFLSGLTQEYSANTNSLAITDLATDRTYYWRVMAYNAYTFCTQFSDHSQFQTTQLTSVNSAGSIGQLSVYPNLLHAGQPLRIDLETAGAFLLSARLFGISGQMVQEEVFNVAPGDNTLTINVLPNLPQGIYTLELADGRNRNYTRVIVN